MRGGQLLARLVDLVGCGGGLGLGRGARRDERLLPRGFAFEIAQAFLGRLHVRLMLEIAGLHALDLRLGGGQGRVGLGVGGLVGPAVEAEQDIALVDELVVANQSSTTRPEMLAATLTRAPWI